ncbi:NUDIX domain-containing protein [Bacillus sp. FJAT-53711]|uniref:NUDIX domain-containing protein n=1 Tax=Bacillus yunxiaonensis TaxID=3127665 RepID=A0ABU8FQY0_9BACI
MINKLRIMTTAYLFNEDEILLMQRSMDKKLAPGMWSGIGGHVEANEHENIKTSCLREIQEETGLTAEHILSFKLRYIILRQKDNELRQQYIYFGQTTTKHVGETREGKLHWIPRQCIFNREMTESNRFTLQHYLENHSTQHVWVGVMGERDSKAIISWMQMRDWEEPVLAQ